MFRNYIKVAFRNILRYKGYSFINIVGFAIGLACCLMILIYTMDELSYDRYNRNLDRLYRVRLEAALGGHNTNGPITCAPLAQAMMAEIPEVQAATRFRNFGFPVLRYKNKVFSEERFFAADSNFFDVFTVQFLKGDPASALTKPNTLLLTRSMASKYFGDEDPLGKTLNMDNRTDYVVTGIVEDVPRNTHFHYDFLGSLASWPNSRNPNWVSNNYFTYVLLREGAQATDVEDKLAKITRIHSEPQIRQFLGVSWEQLLASGAKYNYLLQPLKDIHLRSHLEYEIEPNGDIAYIYIFSLIALGIFIVACINYVNLATARSMTRAKEIAIRKTVGSDRRQLIAQFISETLFASIIAMIIALALVAALRPLFNSIAGKEATIGVLANPYLVPTVLAMLLVSSLLAGAYPAFYLASFQPAAVLTRARLGSKKNSLLRTVLVIFQFSVSIILIIGTAVVFRQMQYIQNKNLGFTKEQVLVVKKTDDIGRQIAGFKEELLRNPDIVAAANTTNLMGESFGNSVFSTPSASGERSQLLWNFATDADFARVFGIEMAWGRYFEKDRLADTGCAVLNETAARALDIKDPATTEVAAVGGPQKFPIIGIVKDFNFESLHQEIKPLALFLFSPQGFGRYMPVKIRTENIARTISSIEATWRKFANNQAFEYEFFDDQFAKVYLAEQRTGNLFLAFAVIAIIVGSLGLFGLAAFMIEQRTKEIGVRKVLGATVPNLVFLLSRQFTKWVLIANVIAWPLAYFLADRWLRDFAYRTDINILIFVLAGAIALAIALGTVSYQAVRSATANPVNSLRYE